MRRRSPYYRLLLHLYPRAHRKQFGPQMEQTLADMMDDAPGPMARATVWIRVARDLPISAAKLQIRDGVEIARNETPRYAAASALLAALCLTPFLVALASNSVARAVNHGTLHNSWAWRTPVLLS